MNEKNYASIVQKYLASTAVRKNLHSKQAIVLERIARGGGATNWFYCKDDASLDVIEQRLSPGSVVSFYFDDRITKTHYSQELNVRIEEIIATTGDCVIGSLEEDSIAIDVDFVTGTNELLNFVSDLAPSTLFFFGQFPAQDNDGDGAITIILPDTDGIVRAHPH